VLRRESSNLNECDKLVKLRNSVLAGKIPITIACLIQFDAWRIIGDVLAQDFPVLINKDMDFAQECRTVVYALHHQLGIGKMMKTLLWFL
jgi:hypothetical protein